MNLFKKVIENRNKTIAVKNNLVTFLLVQVYSPAVIRAAEALNSLPFYVTEDTPLPIQEIIHQSSTLTDDDIQYRLNKYAVTRAVDVLSQYRDCPMPLTNRSDILVTR